MSTDTSTGMIDLEEETICTMTELAQRDDVHVSTVHRWRINGLFGIRLETRRIGGKRVTSFEAAERFHQAVTAAADGPQRQQRDAGRESAKAREKRLERVERELEAAGL